MFYQNPSLALHGNSCNIVRFNFNDTQREKLFYSVYSIQYKNGWLAAWPFHYMFTQYVTSMLIGTKSLNFLRAKNNLH